MGVVVTLGFHGDGSAFNKITRHSIMRRGVSISGSHFTNLECGKMEVIAIFLMFPKHLKLMFKILYGLLK